MNIDKLSIVLAGVFTFVLIVGSAVALSAVMEILGG